MSDPDRYLLDRTGPPDDDVARLERLLAPLRAPSALPASLEAATAGPPPAAPSSPATPSAPRPALRAWAAFAAAAALLVALGVRVATTERPAATARAGAADPAIAVEDGDRRVAPGAWIETTDVARDVRVAAVGRVTVAPGSRLQVRDARSSLARLYLERGTIEARIAADAKPRFFQVDTRAGRCVDLGCRYTLTANADGSARVRVVTGRVAFEAGTREVFVPAGAEVVARPGRGPGTPRFADAGGSLVGAVDAFDALAEDDGGRVAAARRAAEAAASREDLLPIWHWLTDPDAAVARVALARLVERVGRPADWTPPADRPGPADREAFRAHLGWSW